VFPSLARFGADTDSKKLIQLFTAFFQMPYRTNHQGRDPRYGGTPETSASQKTSQRAWSFAFGIRRRYSNSYNASHSAPEDP